MRLTKFTDFAMRVLIFAAAHPDDRMTIEDTAAHFEISQAHVKKVVLTLSRGGFLRGMRGRAGGFALARPPEDINLGEVLRLTEPDFGLFECFMTGNACVISRPCRLPTVAHEALMAFLAVFDRHTLADAQVRPEYFLPEAKQAKQPVRARPLKAA